MAEGWIEEAKLVVSILGFTGTILALRFGFSQYQRAEKWKRQEFVAKEIKEFENDLHVKNAKIMIDWGDRMINLSLKSDPKEDDFKLVTREVQYRALVPHKIKEEYPHSSLENDREGKMQFTLEEAQIRDTFDVFLDYLGRFGNFIEAGLVTEKEFEPYLKYWLVSLTKTAHLKQNGKELSEAKRQMIEKNCENDNKWRLSLLTYINYYEFEGVKYLFSENNIEVNPTGENSVFVGLVQAIKDKDFCNDLLKTLNTNNEEVLKNQRSKKLWMQQQQ